MVPPYNPAHKPCDQGRRVTAPDHAALMQRMTQTLSGRLRPDAAAIGAILLARFASPVHIAVVGHSGTGKTQLVNMLARQQDLQCDITEITITENPGQVRAAICEADIVLWCGQTFDAADLAVWTKVPDALKDHSFFVLTKADKLTGQGLLDQKLRSIGDAVMDEFHSLFPVATLQAIASLNRVQADQTPALRASGAAALITVLRRQIAVGQSAVRDSALLFLARHATAEPAPSAPTIMAQNSPAGASGWTDAFAYLERQARDLGPAMVLPDAEKISLVLSHCCDTADGLALIIADQPALKGGLADDAKALPDTMLLLRLEGNALSAVDALTLLLQVRRDIAACVDA